LINIVEDVSGPQFGPNDPLKRLKRVVIFISLLLLLISFTQVAYCTDDTNANEPCANSLLIFIIGWLGGCLGASVTWLANPLLILTYFLLTTKPKFAFITGVWSFVIALSFLFFRDIMVDEAGHFAKITGYGIGYWLWLCSALAAAIGSGVVYFMTKSMSK